MPLRLLLPRRLAPPHMPWGLLERELLRVPLPALPVAREEEEEEALGVALEAERELGPQEAKLVRRPLESKMPHGLLLSMST